MKVLFADSIFTSPTGDATATLYGNPSHAKIKRFAGQRQYVHFLSHFKTTSVGPVPGIEPSTSCSAVKCSTD